MQPTLHPYLTYQHAAREAMEFYKSVFGGTLTTQSFGESGMPCEESEKDLLIHAELKTDYFTLMASDGGVRHPITIGDNISLSIVGEDEALLTKYFNALAEGGTADMPLAKQYWGDTFGMLTDKFGIHWMVNISAKH